MTAKRFSSKQIPEEPGLKSTRTCLEKRRVHKIILGQLGDNAMIYS